MKLDEFVKETLLQINKGIKDAEIEDKIFYLENKKSKGVHFDLVVTSKISEESKMKGEVKAGMIEVLGVKVGTNNTTSETDEYVNRIQFNVDYKGKMTGK